MWLVTISSIRNILTGRANRRECVLAIPKRPILYLSPRAMPMKWTTPSGADGKELWFVLFLVHKAMWRHSEQSPPTVSYNFLYSKGRRDIKKPILPRPCISYLFVKSITCPDWRKGVGNYFTCPSARHAYKCVRIKGSYDVHTERKVWRRPLRTPAFYLVFRDSLSANARNLPFGAHILCQLLALPLPCVDLRHERHLMYISVSIQCS